MLAYKSCPKKGVKWLVSTFIYSAADTCKKYILNRKQFLFLLMTNFCS